jgi:cold shock CspA family protein
VLRGRVEAFDDHRGDGHIRSDDGGIFYFHCVNIADGSRHVDAGELVTASRAVGHLGHDEAREIVKLKDQVTRVAR